MNRCNEIVCRVIIHAPPETVWAVVRDISSHVSWMADAESITFTSALTEGVGTEFDCVTKIGPISLVDKMRVDSWDEGWSMGVSHVGVVTGVGEFRLRHAGDGATEFTWREQLTFPWWLAGQAGFLVAGRWVLTAIWRGNLRRLKKIIEA